MVVDCYIEEFMRVLDELLEKYEFPRRKRKIKNELWRYYSGKYEVISWQFAFIRGIARFIVTFIDGDNIVALNISYISGKISRNGEPSLLVFDKALGKVLEHASFNSEIKCEVIG